MKLFLLTVVFAWVTLTFQSCLDDDGYSLGKYWIEVATIESLENNAHFFRLDDGKSLWPTAGYYTGHNLGDGQRIWLNYTILSDSMDGFSHYVRVNGLDPVLTKGIAADKGEENDVIYGTDPVNIENIWIGDGYLNVLFVFNYGGQETHFVNLLKDKKEEDLYSVEFRHNAYNDPARTGVRGIVCFDLRDLPDTEGETVKLKIRVNTFDGEKIYELDYNSDKNFPGKKILTEDTVYFERVN
ncbi:NigD-like protein [Parabacteroides sp. PM5-20]|uniref:NigD-like protein n=1 Tax=Parabacteroides sp. PM5-20 TaxID=2940527 RepID=UPI0024749A01|nr:NigD-like protein [Parabacteroides sp. PM5-20]